MIIDVLRPPAALNLMMPLRPVLPGPVATFVDSLDLAARKVVDRPAPTPLQLAAPVTGSRPTLSTVRREALADYRAHATFALAMERIADAQDEVADPAKQIGRVSITYTDGEIHVACERADALRGMLDGMLGYMACLSDPVISARIAERNGADVLSESRLDAAKKIAWATTESAALTTAIAGHATALAKADGIRHDIDLSARYGAAVGGLDLSNDAVRSQLMEHFAELQWPKAGALRGALMVDDDVAATVAAWGAWATASCRQLWYKVAPVRGQLGELLAAPEYAPVLAQIDQIARFSGVL